MWIADKWKDYEVIDCSDKTNNISNDIIFNECISCRLW